MDGPELVTDEPPPGTRRRRLRSLLPSASASGSVSRAEAENEAPHRASRLLQGMRMPVPGLLRRLTTRNSANTRASDATALEASDTTPTSRTTRRRPFSSLGRSENRRYSWIHQETVTTISERDTSYAPVPQNDNEGEEHEGFRREDVHELEAPTLRTTPGRLGRSHSRRMSWGHQMSNLWTGLTSATRSSRSSSNIFTPRSRMSMHEPIAELEHDGYRNRDSGFRPPTPARMSSSDRLDDGDESEYERGYTPRRSRLRPRPVVGEPHDEDYIQRRRESDRRARRATWGPSNNPYSLRESSLESLEAAQPAELPGSTPTWAPSRMPSLFGRGFSNSREALPEPAQLPVAREGRPGTGSGSSPMMFRPALALRQLLTRRNSSRNNGNPDAPSTIPLAELHRLLASYAAQSSDRDYNGHQETTVDGGTITIYGIRRVNARSSLDSDRPSNLPPPTSASDSGGLFPPPSPNEDGEGQSPFATGREGRGRERRGPRRIFNFIGPGLSEIDPLPPEFEETFERLRRTRRPRSMFGSGSLRRNGVVEPDVPSTSNTNNDDATQSADEGTSSSSNGGADRDSDETWIFYIVSAVLPEGHPLLSAPSLFTDNPTYEDMLFLDSFLQKPVASRDDLARARGLYDIRRNEENRLYARSRESEEDVIMLGGDEAEKVAAEGEEDEAVFEERCLICLGEFEVAEVGRKLRGCGHFFHRECVDTWLTEGRNSCPLCRGEGVAKKRERSSRHNVTAGPSRSGPANARSSESLSVPGTP